MSEEDKKLEAAAEEALKEKPQPADQDDASGDAAQKEATPEAAEASSSAGAAEATPAAEPAETPAKSDAAEEDPAVAARRAAREARAAARLQQADPKAQTTSEPSDSPAAELAGPSDAEKEAKAKAAAEARAARAAARGQKTEEGAGEPAAPKEPSPNQPKLDRIVQLIKENVAEDAVAESYINERDRHLPCVIVKSERWSECAVLLKDHQELQMNYLRNVSGVDYETHLEVVFHLLSLASKQECCVKVRTDRETPSIPSVTPIWATANWNEREVYDLLGIDFPGHPDLRRIMMADDWIGYPLRKDFVPYDPEV